MIVVVDTADRIKQLATYSRMYLKKLDGKNGVLSKMKRLSMLKSNETSQAGVIKYAVIMSVM